jgi:predicted metal-dependent HD superfamily phosphohydrolase
LSGSGAGVWEALTGRYAEPHRHYHNLAHVGACLHEFAPVSRLVADPLVLELAIWFHDVIYDTHAGDNELRSAELAGELLGSAGLESDRLVTVRELIMATRHDEPVPSGDAAWMVDIDLTILGQPRARYARFEEQIRAEYAWVAPATYSAERTRVLERFLRRPRLFQTVRFADRYEATARANLAWAIGQLGMSGNLD